MNLRMTVEEREAFLAGLHVGVLSIADDGAGGPWLVPIWYGYQPGGVVRIITGRDSRKTRLARAAGRASLCVQTEQPPYKYVTVEGPVVGIEEPVDTEERRAIAHRYLGVEMGDGYIAATAGMEAGQVAISLRPERWLTVDYSKQS